MQVEVDQSGKIGNTS